MPAKAGEFKPSVLVLNGADDGNVAAAFSYGDYTAAGVGTVTAVCEGEALLFGRLTGGPLLTGGLLWSCMLTFAQLSDPHLSCPAPLRATDLLGKRALGYLSWRLARRRRHLAGVLAALVQDLRAAQADHVVVTGDLTHLGLPHEFEQARRWLDALGPAPALSVRKLPRADSMIVGIVRASVMMPAASTAPAPM